MMASPTTQDDESEGASSLMELFAPPPPPAAAEPPKPATTTAMHELGERPSSNGGRGSTRSSHSESTPLLQDSSLSPTKDSLGALFEQHVKHWSTGGASLSDKTPKTVGGRKQSVMKDSLLPNVSTVPALPSIREPDDSPFTVITWAQRVKKACYYVGRDACQSTTFIGSFMALLFQLVFALTMGAAMQRPHAANSIVGMMTKQAAAGVMFGSAVYWLSLTDIPALYPTCDLFAAPFLANIVAMIDEALYQDPSVSEQENDAMFFASFTFLASLSVFLSGTLLVLASVFKLANLGSFLPFPVLCGFFSAAGVLTWTLAFKVDNNGKAARSVFFSGDIHLILNSLLHHLPSVVVAAVMKYLGPKNPFYVAALVFATIGLFYVAMFAFGISLDEMVQREWFFSKADLHYEPMDAQIGFAKWAPPVPLGWINSLFHGKVHWGAVWAGLDTTVALSFLYLIRCSLHGAALKKNVSNLVRFEVPEKKFKPSALTRVKTDTTKNTSAHHRNFSEAVDIENLFTSERSLKNGSGKGELVTAKPTHASLQHILMQYGLSQYVCALVGSFSIIPNVAISPTMYTVSWGGMEW
jgi:hypothetical protein